MRVEYEGERAGLAELSRLLSSEVGCSRVRRDVYYDEGLEFDERGGALQAPTEGNVHVMLTLEWRDSLGHGVDETLNTAKSIVEFMRRRTAGHSRVDLLES